MSAPDTLLEELARSTFGFFQKHTDPHTGLVQDSTDPGGAASIAGCGLALACWPVAAERGWVTRAEARDRVRTLLRFLAEAPQGEGPDAIGYRGFFYHFLDPRTGRRWEGCELSTLDSALLIAGALTASAYFQGDLAPEREIRDHAEQLYRAVDWQWALRGELVSHGWKPERGFLPHVWTGYTEALFLYLLGLGSPTSPLPPESYTAWTRTYRWKKLYGHELVYAGPLFIHQLSHLWLDFRGIQDAYMRQRSIDYFENSRRATYVQREYAIRNPRGFAGYGPDCWGITASAGPGPVTRKPGGVPRRFYGYHARGVPWGPDDGTLSAWAVATSLPFAPEIVLPALRYFHDELHDLTTDEEGYKSSFNLTFRNGQRHGWTSEDHLSIDQGPVILMLENYRSGLVWRLLRDSPHLARGLERAGFQRSGQAP
jgi:hypothetical protein